METTLIYTGITCVLAAIIGGGLKAFQIEMPVFSSVKRQVMLAVAGGILIFSGILAHNTDPTVDDVQSKAEESKLPEPKPEPASTPTEFTNRWKSFLELKDVTSLVRASGIPFTFQNEFVGDSSKLRSKYENFFQNAGKSFSSTFKTMIFGGGECSDSVIMLKGLYNDAFRQSRNAILEELSITTQIRDSDYFYLWVSNSNPTDLTKTIQCSVLLRSNGPRYKVIAFNYD